MTAEPTIHELKCWPEYLELIRQGRKTFEVRDCRDRDFREGDTVVLRGFEPGAMLYTNHRPVEAEIGYVLPPGAWGLPPTKVVFSLLNVRLWNLETTEEPE